MQSTVNRMCCDTIYFVLFNKNIVLPYGFYSAIKKDNLTQLPLGLFPLMFNSPS
jgi:hypothetical protein